MVFAGAAAGAAGLSELFGLKKSASVFFTGEGDGVIVGEAAAEALALRLCFSAGEGDASVPAAGEALAVASAFLCDLCLAGDADASGDGDCALTAHVAARPTISNRVRSLVFMSCRLLEETGN
jgi:hypothetical protein